MKHRMLRNLPRFVESIAHKNQNEPLILKCADLIKKNDLQAVLNLLKYHELTSQYRDELIEKSLVKPDKKTLLGSIMRKAFLMSKEIDESIEVATSLCNRFVWLGEDIRFRTNYLYESADDYVFIVVFSSGSLRGLAHYGVARA